MISSHIATMMVLRTQTHSKSFHHTSTPNDVVLIWRRLIFFIVAFIANAVANNVL